MDQKIALQKITSIGISGRAGEGPMVECTFDATEGGTDPLSPEEVQEDSQATESGTRSSINVITGYVAFTGILIAINNLF